MHSLEQKRRLLWLGGCEGIGPPHHSQVKTGRWAFQHALEQKVPFSRIPFPAALCAAPTITAFLVRLNNPPQAVQANVT